MYRHLIWSLFCYEGDGMKLSLNNKIAPVIVAGMQGQTVEAPVNKAASGGGFSSVEKSTDSNDHEEAFQAESSGNIVKSPPGWNLLCSSFRGCRSLRENRR